jgi:hypothetical protein
MGTGIHVAPHGSPSRSCDAHHIPLQGRIDRYAAQFQTAPAYEAAVLLDGTSVPPLPKQNDSQQRPSNCFWWTRANVAWFALGIAAYGGLLFFH